MPDFAALDNPLWHALTSIHAPLARAHGRARSYLPEVSPLSAVERPAGLADLRGLAGPGQRVSVLSDGPLEAPAGMAIVRELYIDQMVCPSLLARGREHPFVELGETDVPAMVELTSLTQPGPFLPGTIRMGRYIGVKVDGRLAAMAGQRMRMDGFTEISAVCTHPDFQGRGYASALVTPLVEQVFAEGRTPFLHVKTSNAGAKSVYGKIGFSVRRAIRYTVLTPVA